MDWVYERPYSRAPHPRYGKANIPAYKMIRFSVAIQRGCFGGCTFCSITEHEGRIIQSRSEDSVLREIGEVRDKVPGFTGVIPISADRPPTCTARLQEPRDRERLPPALLRVPGHLPQSQHRSRAAHQPLPRARALPASRRC